MRSSVERFGRNKTRGNHHRFLVHRYPEYQSGPASIAANRTRQIPVL